MRNWRTRCAPPRRAGASAPHRLAELTDRIVRGGAGPSREWTAARKKDSLQRVLEGSRGDAARLQQRLRQLVASWDTDSVEGTEPSGETMPAPLASETMPAPLEE